MKTDVERWIKNDGEEFLRRIGIKEGYVVLDFGCNEGHYTIPAAKVVGNKGMVYAIDIDKGPLDRLKRMAEKEGLENILIIQNSGENIPLKNESVDVVLLYDVLHYMNKSKRKRLFNEVYRILRQDGFLSVYPRHTLENHPLWEFADVTLEEVRKEIEDANFNFIRSFLTILIHDENYTKDHVLNFGKSKK